MKEEYEQIKSALAAGCSQAQFQSMKCPKCGGGLVLSVHPKGQQFHVRCSVDSTHLSMHGETGNPPEWWSQVDKLGWY